MPRKVEIQTRRGTAAEWTSVDPILASGELGFETDTNKFKIGDGSTVWSSLVYFATETYYDDLYLLLTGGTLTGELTITPATDAVDAVTITDEDDNVILSVDTVNNRVGIGTADPDSKLEVNGDVHIDGDLFFETEGSGLPYGNCYGDGIAWLQEEAVDSQWYRITDADMVSGELNLITHDGSGRLTFTKAGRYLITYDIVWEGSESNGHVEFGLDINGSGTPHPASIMHDHTKTADAETPVSGTTILDITTAGHTLDVCIRDIDGSEPDLTVDDLRITVTMVGGT